jgi:hypothetical protein
LRIWHSNTDSPPIFNGGAPRRGEGLDTIDYRQQDKGTSYCKRAGRVIGLSHTLEELESPTYGPFPPRRASVLADGFGGWRPITAQRCCGTMLIEAAKDWAEARVRGLDYIDTEQSAGKTAGALKLYRGARAFKPSCRR